MKQSKMKKQKMKQLLVKIIKELLKKYLIFTFLNNINYFNIILYI